jgi:hypothetical protein
MTLTQRAAEGLLVQPDMFEAPIVIDAVFVVHVALEMRVPAGGRAIVVDDRPGHVLRQDALDLPDDRFALVPVRLLRLLIEKLVDLGVQYWV